MNARIPERSWQRVASFGLVYFGLGVGSAVISNDVDSAPVQASMRVGIFLVAVAVFSCHLRVELARSAERLGASALISSSALAVGTFLLAVYAVSMSWWDSSHVPTSLLSAFGCVVREFQHPEIVDDEQGDSREVRETSLASADETRLGDLLQQGVRLSVDHEIALLDSGALDGLREVALASARHDEKESVLALLDEVDGR